MMIHDMDIQTLVGHLRNGTVTLIDVREAHEFQAGHIEGAKSIPLSVFPSQFHRADYPLDKPVVLQCQAGVRSMKACNVVSPETDVYNLVGGLNAWIVAGLDVVTSE